MKAPCGIEIRVGQVWRGVGRWQNGGYDFTVKATESHRGFHLVKLSVRPGDNHWVDLLEFTNKRGGYRLVRDVKE